MEGMQEEVSQDHSYKQIIGAELGQLKRGADRGRFIQFFRKYWFQREFVVPPWAEADLAFYKREKCLFTYLGKRIGDGEIPTRDSQLGWAPLPKSKQWARVIKDQCVPPKIYFTCNLWKKGTPSEAAELEFLRTQLLEELLIYPGNFDFGTVEAPERAAFCHAVVWFYADILIFSEFEAEYGLFIGFGVYHDILEARKKGIPILLLREEQFWLNPRLKVHDKENLVCYAKVRATPHPPIQYLEELFYLGDG